MAGSSTARSSGPPGRSIRDYGVIIARNDPTVPKHKGLTFFWVDMHAPGVTVRPIKLAAGDSHVNEVFFDDVRLGDDQRLSAVGGGFGVAIATLMIERYSASDPAGFGPPLAAFIALAQAVRIGGRPAIEDGRIRSAIARAYAMRAGLAAITARAMRMMEAGMEPGPEGSLNKLVAVRSRQKLSELAIDLAGNLGLGWDPAANLKEDWVASWLSAPTDAHRRRRRRNAAQHHRREDSGLAAGSPARQRRAVQPHSGVGTSDTSRGDRNRCPSRPASPRCSASSTRSSRAACRASAMPSWRARCRTPAASASSPR